MTLENEIILGLLMLVAALLYASVGHAGASGYLAAMALVGVPAPVMKPTALVLNLLVASVASVQFARAGYFRLKFLLPFAIGSIPFAFLGGALSLPTTIYKPLVGIVLLFSAARLLGKSAVPEENELRAVPPAVGVGCGAAIGLLSGLTGTGGGIFLSPLLLWQKWATLKQAAGTACVFIWVNSLAGLLGQWNKIHNLPSALPFWAVAVLVGGGIGSYLGSSRLPVPILKRLLACVLVIAGGKLVWEGFQSPKPNSNHKEAKNAKTKQG